MAHLLEASIMNLSILLKHEAANGLQDDKEKKQQSLEELADIARLLASWSAKYSPNKMLLEDISKHPHIIIDNEKQHGSCSSKIPEIFPNF